jgi:hypothetical protein
VTSSTIDRFLIRYAGGTLRGCLLEPLASFRPNLAADERIAAIDTEDPNLVEAPATTEWQGLQEFLADRKVAIVTADNPDVVSVDDPATQQVLDREPGVRAVLDSNQAKTALLEGREDRSTSSRPPSDSQARSAVPSHEPAHSPFVTAIKPPDAVHYRSRHDDHEDCWAIYDHADVTISVAENLSHEDTDHASALRRVAELWDLPLPPNWRS